jgi:hypothetical protein
VEIYGSRKDEILKEPEKMKKISPIKNGSQF